MKNNLLLLVFISVFIISCTHHEKSIKRRDIIPEKDFIPILEDIHLADAIISNPSLVSKYPGLDTLSNYKDILMHHGYTMEDLDKTLMYYTGKPEQLEKIYEKVIDDLSQLESEVRSKRYFEDEEETKSVDLWTSKSEWHLPVDGKQIKIPFSIAIDTLGIYILRAQIKMYQDDGSSSPEITAYYWYDDGSELGKRYLFPKSQLSKNGQWKSHALILETHDSLITHIKGFLVDHTDKHSSWEKHLDIRGVSLKLMSTGK